MSRYEDQLFSYFQNLQNYIRVQPLILGAVTGSGGGSGGPPGGFVGRIPQSRVTYDLSELSKITTSADPSLVDNLNHMRYRISILEASGIGGSAGGSFIIQKNDAIIGSGVTILNFEGPSVISVTEDYIGKITVYISGVGGGGGGAVNLDDLGDVTILSPSDNDLLAYDISSLQWKNQTAAQANLSTTSHTHSITFLDLTDTPDSYSGNSGKVVAVKGDASGLEFTTVSGVSGGATDILMVQVFT